MKVVWLNGALCPVDQACLPVTDRGLTLGDGLFETFRVSGGHVLHTELHMARLRAGGKVLDLPVPELKTVEQAASDLLKTAGVESGSLRLTVTRGSGPRGILPPAVPCPSVFMTVTEGKPFISDITLMTSRLVRQDEQSVLCQFKTLNYVPFILARQEAARAGADDALILNTQGRVAETTVSSVLVQKKGRFLTPPASEGALPGVSCSVLRRQGLAEEAMLTHSDLMQAEAVYLVNSLGLRCVLRLDGMPLRQSREGFCRLYKGLSLLS